VPAKLSPRNPKGTVCNFIWDLAKREQTDQKQQVDISILRPAQSEAAAVRYCLPSTDGEGKFCVFTAVLQELQLAYKPH
jgi:hypothetical protein